MQKNVTYLKPADLVLDINNPRFGELYTGSNNEDDLIEYLLYNESAASLVDRLAQTKEFYVDKPLLVFDNGTSKIVKDGNRRCAAVKALENPIKYGLTAIQSYKFPSVPAVIYTDKTEIENRIIEEHTNSLFREWDRMAKAIEVFRSFTSGSSIEAMEEIDSQPAILIKLASFYYEAVKIGGDDLKKLLRKGRGGTGGKTTIFERLFKYANICGYRFQNKPNYVIDITDSTRFKEYIETIVKYLTDNPSTTYRDVDEKTPTFFTTIGLSSLVTPTSPPPPPGTTSTPQGTGAPSNPSTPTPETGSTGTLPAAAPVPAGTGWAPTPPAASGSGTTPTHVNRVQRKPQYNRTIPGPLKKVIDECYDLNELNFTNSKIAMTRVAFECCLKYVIEETKYNNILLKDTNYFKGTFPPQSGSWTNFKKLKTLFQGIVINTGKKQAFSNFDLDTPHQIIHNYNVSGLIREARTLCDNLIPLIEFMLDTESTFLANIDTSRL